MNNGKDKHGCRYTFKPSQCVGCSLREPCLQNPQGTKGRSVTKNDYEAEYRKVREKAATPEYAPTRRVHPKIERKGNDWARRQGNRRGRYRGLGKVHSQSFLTALVTNVKRRVKWLAQKMGGAAGTPAVRAELSQA